jgi:hypothetical protein
MDILPVSKDISRIAVTETGFITEVDPGEK